MRADFNWVRRLLSQHGTTEPELSPQLRGLWAESRSSTLADFTLALEEQDQFRSEMLVWMRHYDAVLAPGAVSAAAKHDHPGDDGGIRSVRANYWGAYNLAGWPGATVRCGTSAESLPIGVQILAAPWREDIALAIAAQLEQTQGGWRPPP